jgi:hypothetical protein
VVTDDPPDGHERLTQLVLVGERLVARLGANIVAPPRHWQKPVARATRLIFRHSGNGPYSVRAPSRNVVAYEALTRTWILAPAAAQ